MMRSPAAAALRGAETPREPPRPSAVKVRAMARLQQHRANGLFNSNSPLAISKAKTPRSSGSGGARPKRSEEEKVARKSKAANKRMHNLDIAEVCERHGCHTAAQVEAKFASMAKMEAECRAEKSAYAEAPEWQKSQRESLQLQMAEVGKQMAEVCKQKQKCSTLFARLQENDNDLHLRELELLGRPETFEELDEAVQKANELEQKNQALYDEWLADMKDLEKEREDLEYEKDEFEQRQRAHGVEKLQQKITDLQKKLKKHAQNKRNHQEQKERAATKREMEQQENKRTQNKNKRRKTQ